MSLFYKGTTNNFFLHLRVRGRLIQLSRPTHGGANQIAVTLNRKVATRSFKFKSS